MLPSWGGVGARGEGAAEVRVSSDGLVEAVRASGSRYPPGEGSGAGWRVERRVGEKYAFRERAGRVDGQWRRGLRPPRRKKLRSMQEWNLFDERGWQVHWATEKVYFLDFEFFFFFTNFPKKKSKMTAIFL